MGEGVALLCHACCCMCACAIRKVNQNIFAIGLGTPNGGMRVATALKSSILVMRIFVREQLTPLGDSKTESTPSQFENIVQDHGKHEMGNRFAIHCSGSIFIFRAFSKFVQMVSQSSLTISCFCGIPENNCLGIVISNGRSLAQRQSGQSPGFFGPNFGHALDGMEC